MYERLCNLFEPCETPDAPLCPIQENTLKHGIWYRDEPICKAKQFQELPWIKKQKQIAKLKLKTDVGYFTVKMLNAIRVISVNIRGADPDDSKAELKWLKARTEKRARAAEKRIATKAAKGDKVNKTKNIILLQRQDEKLSGSKHPKNPTHTHR